MKKITLLLVIIFTFLFSTISWGEWNYVINNVRGDKYYYDKDRLRKNGKYLYFWMLTDYLKPVGDGMLSTIVYRQLDCSIFREKILKFISYNKNMGEGTIREENIPSDEWRYPLPNTTTEVFFKKVCEEHQ